MIKHISLYINTEKINHKYSSNRIYMLKKKVYTHLFHFWIQLFLDFLSWGKKIKIP